MIAVENRGHPLFDAGVARGLFEKRLRVQIAVNGNIAQKGQIAFEVKVGAVKTALIPDGILGCVSVAEGID